MYMTLKDGRKIRMPSDEEAAARQKRLSRPPLESPKEQLNIRLSAQGLAAFHATGKGWQTRIDNRLGKAIAQGQV